VRRLTDPSGPPLTVRELSGFLASQGLARGKHPEFIWTIDEMPVNAGGKYDKALLRQAAPGQLLARTAPAGSPEARIPSSRRELCP
jgi:acyl-CoA synthetase (AMP-forming)/AMP-acid ligase II